VSLYQTKNSPTHPHEERRRRIRMDNKVHCVKARPLYSALSLRWLLDSVRPAYNQSRPDGLLRLTASAFNQLWISMLAVLVTVTTVMQNSLHLLSTSSIFAHHKTPYVMKNSFCKNNCVVKLLVFLLLSQNFTKLT